MREGHAKIRVGAGHWIWGEGGGIAIGGVQWYSDVLARHSIMELKINVIDHLQTTATLLLQPEQMTKKVEVGKNSEIRLIEMDKDRYVQYGVWVEIAQLTLQNSNRSLKKG